MALAPGTQEFFEVRKALSAAIKEGVIKDEDTYDKVLIEQGYDPEEFDRVEKDYLENAAEIELKAKDEAESLIPDPLNIIAPAVQRVGTGISNLIPEPVETLIEKGVDAIDDKLLSTEYGRQLSYMAKEIADPRRTKTEDLVGDLAGFIGGYLVTRGKVNKFVPARTKIGKGFREAATAISADAMMREEDEQFTNDILKLLPELEEPTLNAVDNPDDPEAQETLKNSLANAGNFALDKVNKLTEALELNPDDSALKNKLKQFADSAVGFGLITGTLATGFKLGGLGLNKTSQVLASEAMTKGGQKVASKLNALKEGVLEPIAQSPSVIATKAKVVESIPKTFRQEGQAYEMVAALNTGLARGLTSSAAMPKKLFESYLNQVGFLKGGQLFIDKEMKTLSNLVKKKDASIPDVNKVLRGEKPVKKLDKQLEEQVLKMRSQIDDQEVVIKDGLNIPENSKLGIAISDEGTPYITRAFEFTTNPEWSKDIVKVLKNKPVGAKSVRGKLTGNILRTSDDKAHNADIVNIVDEARTHIKKKNKNLSDEDVDVLIKNTVSYGPDSKSASDFIKALTGGKTGEAAQKVLMKRKKIDKPILQLLGEVDNPLRMYQTTMQAQQKLIAKNQFLKDVENFALNNLDTPVPLGGFVPGLPVQQAKFITSKQAGKLQGKNLADTDQSLKAYAQKEIGTFGGKANNNMSNLFTTPQMIRIIDSGTDFVDDYLPSGMFSTVMGVGQSSETVLDHTAHAINMYGAGQALFMNGNLINKNIAKGATKSAKDLFEKAAKGQDLLNKRQALVSKKSKTKDDIKQIKDIDKKLKESEEALARLGRLKSYGMIDSNIVSEGIEKNLSRYGEGIETAMGKAVKAPFRGAAALYGGADDFAKIIALESEMVRYGKAFPKMKPLELEAYVAKRIVRNVMPSYSTAAPFVRGLARIPFGTYATFPAEVLRTTKNIIKVASEDVAEGMRTNNQALVQAGLERLTSSAALAVGISASVAANNEAMGVGDSELRAINMVMPDYQKTSDKWITAPLKIDPKTGEAMVSFIDTGALDSLQYIKGPLSSAMGSLTAGKELTEREIDDMFSDAVREIYGPYISSKFLTQALTSIIRGETEYGRPVDTLERASKEILKVFVPGTVKAGKKLEDSYAAELLEGRGYGRTASGFPLVYEDQKLFYGTGIRKTTVNFNKAISMSLYNDMQEITKNRKNFELALKDIPQRILTEEDKNVIYKSRVDMLIEERELLARLSDKIKVISEAEVITDKKDADGELIRKPFGFSGVYKAATSTGKYKINPNVLTSFVKGKESSTRGVHIPQFFETKDIVKLRKDRKFPKEVLNNLMEIDSIFTNKPLRRDGEQ